MSRPQRIEFENAYYHVMNRGAGSKNIFHDHLDREQFLFTIDEAHQQFGIEIHAYCLMSNHYHLLIKTPLANLGRAMRHINGVYTQRFNRKNSIDGPLFRGRYKAILVDSDSYLLHLSKYIHLNPLNAGLVTKLERYPWSSYPAYIAQVISPNWLVQSEVYGQLSTAINKAEHYRFYVNNLEMNPLLIDFYKKQRLHPVLGDDFFINKLTLINPSKETPRKDRVIKRPTLESIIIESGTEFNQSIDNLITSKKGRGRKNIPRKVAMYIAQKFGDYQLNEIAAAFEVSHYGSVSHAIYVIVEEMKEDAELCKKINNIINRLDP